MDRLLRKLDSVLDAQMLGTAWFEDAEEKFDVDEMADKLCSIPYCTKLNIQDLIQVCRVFFGDDFDEFVEIVENKQIKLRKSPGGVAISDICICPYREPEESNRHDTYDREAIMAFISSRAPGRTVINMGSSRVMILELCKNLLRNSNKKIDLIREIQDRFKEADRVKAEQQQKELEDMKKNRTRLIKILTDDNQALNAWINEVKICQKSYARQLVSTKQYHSPSDLVSELLTAVKKKINLKD